MKRQYHISDRVCWNIDPGADEMARLNRAVISAIRQVLERHTAETSEVATAAVDAAADLRECFSTSRYSPERGAYALPSYDDGGAAEELPVEEITFEEEEADVVTSIMHLHPAGEVDEDVIVSGSSPFEDDLIAVFSNEEAIKVRSERYAIASDLMRAIRWGEYLFGARSYVILEGPFGQPDSRYYVMGTNYAIHTPRPTRGTGTQLAGGEVWGMGGEAYWQTEFRDDDKNYYLLRALFTSEGNPMFPPNFRLAEEFFAELSLAPPERGSIPLDVARPLVFAEIDDLIANDDIEEAARRLAELDANAFGLVDWKTKARYLQVLIDAWTFEAQEIAIVEIIKSITSRSELDGALGLLRAAGVFDQLFSDLDSQIWGLLVLVGERFADPAPMTFDALIDLMQQARLVPRSLTEVASRIAMGPLGPIISGDVLAEIEEAARGFVRFLGGSLEGIWMLISEPEKIVEGIAQLVRLSATVQLAMCGHQPSIEYIGNVLHQMSQKVVYGLKGVHTLGLAESILLRIKWAIIWEVASWFIGVGEIKAILSSVGITEKVAAIAKITRILGLIGRAADAERLAGKLEKLARIMTRASQVFGHEDDVLRIMAHLPEEDLTRLGRLLDPVEIDETLDLARLVQLHPELGESATDVLRKAEALSQFATKAGGLSDELVEAFGRLARQSGVGTDELVDLIRLVPDGEGVRFARVARLIPDSAFGPGGLASRDFLRMLAESRNRMDSLINFGYETFAAIYDRTGRNARALDEYLDTLAGFEALVPWGGGSIAYRELLDLLRNGDARAWIHLEDARRTRLGLPRLTDLPQVIVGSPRAEAGFQRLLRKGHHNVIDDLLEEVVPHNRALAQRRFEQIGDLTDQQSEGLAVIQHLDENGDIGIHTSWGEVLDLDPGWRDDLLDLTAQLHRSVDDGLDLAIKRGLQGPGTNVQGVLGHMYAARTLQQRFPGARFRFEVPGPRREIDIQMTMGGRTIDVEVKTNLGLEPTVHDRQIRKDIVRHIDDQFQDMLYLYSPQQSGNLQAVEQAMLNALSHTDVQTALTNKGITAATAQTWLQQRFTQGLVDVFNY